ncbi:hypothetical protein Bca52824_075791 [Brassica carinata]|uniref:Uncharacterized protein n=1 Tax=Brassica carinata TaxID=52824 RepID=A0A8X7PTI8_BRACI|nr:hypothetical protein Bca52824_075791 [Brassica carinata]
MLIVPGNSTRLENSVNAILSSANRENLPLLYPGPGDLLDTTSTTLFKFLNDLSLVIPSILAEGWVHDWPTYRTIPDHFKERWFLQLALRNLKITWANGGDKPPWMLTRVWRDLVHMFEEFGHDNFGFRQ